MNAVIIKEGSNKTLISCICFNYANSLDGSINNNIIPVCTQEEAYKKGWKLTTYPLFLGPNKTEAWVCPTCASKYKWVNIK